MTSNLIGRHRRRHEPGYLEAQRADKARRQRAYHQTEAGQESVRRRRKTEKYLAANLRAVHKIRATPEGQEALRARNLARALVKRGRIQRKACEVCGDPKSTIHHPNGYHGAAALDIRFLCWPHHMEAHGRVSA
jgi:hypothetical protein